MIKPTVGRIVWFHPDGRCGEAGFANPPEGQPLAAIVACVHDDRTVTLTVFDARGNPHSRLAVELIQPGDPKPEYDYAEWMPYQVGQAIQQAMQRPMHVHTPESVTLKESDLPKHSL